tara:strand:+ start:483 stop:770 length:288 start_codon:yes stop_codon:yes gene_type:complete
MARYPAVPRLYDELKDTPKVEKVYKDLEQWGGALVNQLDTRDLKVDAQPSTKIYTVTTITDIGSPRKGDIAYAASAGKFKGYVSTTATQAWENLN